MPGSDSEAGYLSLRRVLATALEGRPVACAAVAGARRAVVVHGRASRRSRDGRAIAPAFFREAEAALLFGKRHGRTCVTAYDAERHASPAHASDRSPSWPPRSPTSPPWAPSRRSSSRSTTCGNGQPRGYEGLIRPQPGLRLRRSRRAVRRCRGRRADRRAGPRLPGHLDLRVRRAAPARQPDPQPLAADPRGGRLQRPRPVAAAQAPRRRADAGRPGADRAGGRRGHGPPRPRRRVVSGGRDAHRRR